MVGIIKFLRFVVVYAEEAFSLKKIPGLTQKGVLEQNNNKTRGIFHTKSPTLHISTASPHFILRMTSGARYGTGIAFPRCSLPIRAWPKSQIVSAPAPPSIYRDTYITVSSTCFLADGFCISSSSTLERTESSVRAISKLSEWRSYCLQVR